MAGKARESRDPEAAAKSRAFVRDRCQEYEIRIEDLAACEPEVSARTISRWLNDVDLSKTAELDLLRRLKLAGGIRTSSENYFYWRVFSQDGTRPAPAESAIFRAALGEVKPLADGLADVAVRFSGIGPEMESPLAKDFAAHIEKQVQGDLEKMLQTLIEPIIRAYLVEKEFQIVEAALEEHRGNIQKHLEPKIKRAHTFHA